MRDAKVFRLMATSNSDSRARERWLPKRIILVRHGESKGNKDESTFSNTPDHSIPLTTPKGVNEAREAGTLIRKLFDESSPNGNWKVYVYVSPYERTRSTLKEIFRSFPKSKVVGVREECRVREQDFGNFQDPKKMKELKDIRDRFGRFFYRFPEGESGADVYDRVSNFLETLWRDIDMKRFGHDPEAEELNLVIVSHGLAIRFFLMRWFKWTVKQFDRLKNLKNGEFRVMELGSGGEYSLAIHHDDKQLEGWRLCSEMIDDQKLRATGKQKNGCLWFDALFDQPAEAEAEAEAKAKDEVEAKVDV